MSATSPAGSSSFTQRGPSDSRTKRSRSARIATAVLGSVAMLGVQALQITSANAQTATLCAGGNLVEAEAGVVSGGTVVQQNAAASGGFDVGSFAFPGTQSWTSPTVVPANTNGRTIYLTFRYYATTGATRHLTVNGGLNTITFPATSTYSNFTVALAPAGGPVSYALTVPAANSGGLAVDTVTSCPAEPSGSTTSLAASTTAAPEQSPEPVPVAARPRRSPAATERCSNPHGPTLAGPQSPPTRAGNTDSALGMRWPALGGEQAASRQAHSQRVPKRFALIYGVQTRSR